MPFGGYDAFVAVLDSSSSNLEFASYLGGTGTDQGLGIGLEPSSGDVIVLGSTSSSDLDTLGALQPVYGGGRSDVFVARVDISAPKLTYLAYIGGGGTDRPRKLVVDRTGRALVVGQTTSPDFPVTHDERTGLSAEDNGFAIMLDPMGTTLLYSLLSGGTSTDTFEGAAIGSDGSLTISGASDSVDFPTVAPMQDEFLGGRFDIVVVRILLGLSTL